MQHHWIPTRLLDWSEVVGIPLFFASKYNQRDGNGQSIALYVLDPLKLNSKSGYEIIPRLPGNPEFDYQDAFFNKTSRTPTLPVAIAPNYNNDRLLAQKGVFTIHPSSDKPIEELCPECGIKVIIKPEAIPEILEILDLTNINELSVFPDLQGAADYVRNIFMRI